MFKAILMRLFGLHPHWEVRSVSQLTKKDLPGTRLYSGDSYRKARAAYVKAKEKIKPDHKLKLQAVSVLAMHWKPSVEGIQDAINDEANRRLGNVKDAVQKTGWTEPEIPVPTLSDDLSALDEQADLLPGAMAPLAKEIASEHLCNYSGPMVMGDDGKYHPTCSVCGEQQ
jgi:hypothetical protein